MFCNQCGENNRNDRKFCSNCGAPLKDYTKPRENLLMPDDILQAQELVKKRISISRAFNIAASIVFICFIVFTALSYFTKNTTQIVFISLAIAFIAIFFILIIIKNRKLKKINKQENNK